MKAVELINRAYTFSGTVARYLAQVQGPQGRDGLFLLNQLLVEKSSTGDYLPYYGRYDFFGTIGDDEYTLQGLVTLDTFCFFIGNTRYSMRGETRRNFFGSARQEDILSLPFQYYYEKALGGIKVFLYFKPQGAYRFEAVGITSLPEVTNDTEFDDFLDKYCQVWLIFELAEYICLWNQITLPPATQEKLNEYRKKMYQLNPKDVTINKFSMIGMTPILSYPQINIGKAWVPYGR